MRTLLRLLLKGIGLCVVIVVLALFALGAGVLWLGSPRGEVFLANTVTGVLNDRIMGFVGLEAMRIRLDTRALALRFVLENLSVRDEKGKDVGRIDRVEAGLALRPLMQRVISVPEFKIIRPDIGLVKRKDGAWNALKAFEPRARPKLDPEKEKEKEEGAPFTFDLDAAHLLQGRISVAGLGRPLAFEDINIQGSYAPDEIVLTQLSASGEGVVARGSGAARKSQGRWVPTLDLDVGGKLFGTRPLRLDASISERAFAFEARYEHTRDARLTADIRGSAQDGFRVLNFSSVRVGANSYEIRARAPFRMETAPHLSVEGLRLAVDDHSFVSVDAKRSRDGGMDIALDLDRILLGKLPLDKFLPGRRITGILSGRIHAFGKPARPMGEGTLVLTDAGVFLPGFQAANINLWLEGGLDRAQAEAALQGSYDGVPIRAHAQVPRALVFGRRTDEPLSVMLKVSEVSLARLVEFTGRPLPPHLAVSGAVSLDASARGSLENLKGQARLNMRDWRYGGIKPIQGTWLVGINGAQLATELNIRGEGSNALTLQARTDIGLDALLRRNAQGTGALDPKQIPLNARLDANLDDISAFTAIVPKVTSLGGRFVANLSVDGTIARPNVLGTMALTSGHVKVAGVRDFKDVAFDAQWKGDSVTVSRLEGRFGGRVSARGWADELFSPTRRFNLALATDDFVVDPTRSPTPTLDTRLTLEGTVSPSLLDAVLRVESLRLVAPTLEGRTSAVSVERPDEVVVVTEQRREDVQPARTPDGPEGMAVNLKIEAPRNLLVTGPQIKAEFFANLGVFVAPDGAVKLSGETGLVRPGELEVLGKEFSIRAAKVSFQSEAPKAGDLAVLAVNEARDASIRVGVSGTVGKPEVSLTSDPPMGNAEIIAAFFGGSQPSGDDPSNASGVVNAGATALSFVSNALVSQFQTFLGQRAPVALSLDVEDAREGKASVSVGRYVAQDLYVSYDKRLGSVDLGENASEVEFDYRLSRRWSVEGFYGDGGEGGLDLLWRLRF